jgi:outer membrane immunogenic protein
MKKLLLAAAFVCCVNSAQAADLAKAPNIYVAPNWTGFYVGGEVGYVAGRVPAIAIPTGVNFNAEPSGAIGGVFIGYDYQMPNNWVIGARLAAPVFSTADDRLEDPGFPGQFYEAKIRYAVLGTFQLGYAMGNWMPYVGIGAGVGGGRGEVSGNLFPGHVDETHIGFVANAGFKYLLTPRWFAGLQYTYTNWSKERYTFANGFTADVGAETNSVVFQVGYRF